MATGKKTGGRNFTPGNTLGKGRPVIPSDLKGIDKLTKDHVQRVFSKFAAMTLLQLQEALAAESVTMLERMVGTVIEKAAESGDYSRFSFLLDRMIGKVTGEEDALPAPQGIGLNHLTTEALLKLVKEKTGEAA